MVVASQRQYSQTAPEEWQKPNTGPKEITRKKGIIKRKRKALTRVCIALAIGILVISRFAVISEHNYNIRNMEKELEALQKVNERLQLQHARIMDINWLEDHALHQLGMVYPENRDIVYVAVEKNDDIPLFADKPEDAKKAGFSDGRWFAFLTSIANKVFN